MIPAQANAPHRKASRSGRYRKSLLPPRHLLALAGQIAAVFRALDELRVAGRLSDAEFSGYGLLTLLACRRPDAFQRHPQQPSAAVQPHNTGQPFLMGDFWQLVRSHQLLPDAYGKLLDQELSLRIFLEHIRFRGIPDSAQLALCQWLDQRYPLVLMFHIPPAPEVFDLQKRGNRCVTFLKEANELTGIHHGRDSLSFVVHDLIHAHEFYSHPQRARQQIGFYHWLDSVQQQPDLLALRAGSAAFRERWDYVLSDMNSYCGHLLKTLHAAVAIHGSSANAEDLWGRIVDFSGLDRVENALFKRINTPEWHADDFLQLESVLEKHFQACGLISGKDFP